MVVSNASTIAVASLAISLHSCLNNTKADPMPSQTKNQQTYMQPYSKPLPSDDPWRFATVADNFHFPNLKMAGGMLYTTPQKEPDGNRAIDK